MTAELAAFGVTQFNNNAGDAHSQGFQLEFNWKLAGGLRRRFAGDISESETDEDNVARPAIRRRRAANSSMPPNGAYRPASLAGSTLQPAAKAVAHGSSARRRTVPLGENGLSLDEYDPASLRPALASLDGAGRRRSSLTTCSTTRSSRTRQPAALANLAAPSPTSAHGHG